MTDKNFKVFVGVCVAQILCGLGLAWASTTTIQLSLGLLFAAIGALEFAVFWRARRQNRRRIPADRLGGQEHQQPEPHQLHLQRGQAGLANRHPGPGGHVRLHRPCTSPAGTLVSASQC